MNFILHCFVLKITHLIDLFVQVFNTEKGSKLKAVKLVNGTLKGGAVFPFRLLFTGIYHQLKRTQVWNSLEVHVIYAFVYLLCTNKNGLYEFKTYLGAKDSQVFDPHFIAQYLLVPINTIVKFYLLPWMMEPHYKMRKDNSVAIRNQYRTSVPRLDSS